MEHHHEIPLMVVYGGVMGFNGINGGYLKSHYSKSPSTTMKNHHFPILFRSSMPSSSGNNVCGAAMAAMRPGVESLEPGGSSNPKNHDSLIHLEWNMSEYVGICRNMLEYRYEYSGIYSKIMEYVGICWIDSRITHLGLRILLECFATLVAPV